MSSQELIVVIFSIVGLALAAKAFGLLTVKLKQPSILGELATGIFLGPTVLDWMQASQTQVFSFVRQSSVLLFLVAAGLAIPITSALKNVRISFAVTIGGSVVPFVLGLISILSVQEWAQQELAGPQAEGWQLPLFFATALSISAVPVIAKTLMDLGLYQSRMGVITMTAAVLTDLIAWFLFAFAAGGSFHGLVTLAAFCIGLAWGASKYADRSARFTKVAREWLGPFFFATVGLRVDFAQHIDIVLVLLVLVVACLGKVTGCGIAARVAGLNRGEAWAVAFAMNSRGAMEVILGLAALDAGLITPKLFVALVIMAFATSMLSGPLIRRALRA